METEIKTKNQENWHLKMVLLNKADPNSAIPVGKSDTVTIDMIDELAIVKLKNPFYSKNFYNITVKNYKTIPEGLKFVYNERLKATFFHFKGKSQREVALIMSEAFRNLKPKILGKNFDFPFAGEK